MKTPLTKADIEKMLRDYIANQEIKPVSQDEVDQIEAEYQKFIQSGGKPTPIKPEQIEQLKDIRDEVWRKHGLENLERLKDQLEAELNEMESIYGAHDDQVIANALSWLGVMRANKTIEAV